MTGTPERAFLVEDACPLTALAHDQGDLLASMDSAAHALTLLKR